MQIQIINFMRKKNIILYKFCVSFLFLSDFSQATDKKPVFIRQTLSNEYVQFSYLTTNFQNFLLSPFFFLFSTVFLFCL